MFSDLFQHPYFFFLSQLVQRSGLKITLRVDYAPVADLPPFGVPVSPIVSTSPGLVRLSLALSVINQFMNVLATFDFQFYQPEVSIVCTGVIGFLLFRFVP